MAGNTTVLKHAKNVFGMAQAIQQMYEDAGFPKNVYQSLLIDGSTASDLIKHKHVRGVTFTGSDEVGKEVAKEAASLSKKTVMELGSNDAFLLYGRARRFNFGRRTSHFRRRPSNHYVSAHWRYSWHPTVEFSVVPSYSL